MKTKDEIRKEMMLQLEENIIRKTLAYEYFKQAKGNANYFQTAMAAENEIKELTKQLDFFKTYDNLGTNGVRTEGKVPRKNTKRV